MHPHVMSRLLPEEDAIDDLDDDDEPDTSLPGDLWFRIRHGGTPKPASYTPERPPH